MASELPTNRAAFSLAEILDATGGRCEAAEATVTGVATDTRAPLEGAAFVALRGERFDAHDYLCVAEKRGARLLIVERAVDADVGIPVVQVPSTLQALGDLARRHRDRWGRKVVAVAGSVGKTTTRTAAFALLSEAGCRVHCPPGNLNNRVGVPLVLLSLTDEHEVAVVEVGTSLPGEVATLTRIARPNVAALTRIAMEHAEGLGDLDAIEREEGAVLTLLDASAVAVANADDERCARQLAASPARRRLRHGRQAEGLDYAIESVETTALGRTRVALRRPGGPVLSIDTALLGVPAAYALAAGAALAETALGRPLSVDEARRAGLSRAIGEAGRLVRVELPDGSLVLDDTYNSSPASARSSCQEASALAKKRGARLVLALGEMRELGSFAAREHRSLGEQVAGLEPALLVAFGAHSLELAEAGRRRGIDCEVCTDALAALEVLRERRQAGDLILVKASRGLRAERIVFGLAPEPPGVGQPPEKASG